MRASDLTPKEQANVRTALAFLRFRFGTVTPLAKALKFKEASLKHVREGRAVSASLAFRVARLVNVPIDDLLTGKFPAPGTCPHCGRGPDGEVIKLAAE
jgi:hypothetical protein